jgi:molybdate transport system substrate-binding protein
MGMRLKFVVWSAVFISIAPAGAAAEIRILSDGVLEPALSRLVEAYSERSGQPVAIKYAIGRALRARVVVGENVDVFIAPARDVDELTASGRVVASLRAAIARVGVALSTRYDAPAPDISTPERLRQAVLRADSLVYSSRESGQYFANVLERLGIAHVAKAKTTRFYSGADAFDEVLRRRGHDFAVGLTTQINAYGRNGLRLVGPLPDDVQSYIVIHASVLAKSKSKDAARDFVGFLVSPYAQSAFAAIGAN